MFNPKISKAGVNLMWLLILGGVRLELSCLVLTTVAEMKSLAKVSMMMEANMPMIIKMMLIVMGPQRKVLLIVLRSISQEPHMRNPSIYLSASTKVFFFRILIKDK